MCNYQGYEFGAGSYPDSVCIEGKLYDADHCDSDGNLYENDQDIPCPMCRPTDAVEYWVKQNEMSGSHAADAIRAAMSLVDDIRAKRGVFDEFEPPKNEG